MCVEQVDEEDDIKRVCVWCCLGVGVAVLYWLKWFIVIVNVISVSTMFATIIRGYTCISLFPILAHFPTLINLIPIPLPQRRINPFLFLTTISLFYHFLYFITFHPVIIIIILRINILWFLLWLVVDTKIGLFSHLLYLVCWWSFETADWLTHFIDCW